MPKGDARGPEHASAIRKGRMLTSILLKELDRIHDELDEDGQPMNKAQAIIKGIVRDATGWEEKAKNDKGQDTTIKHPAVAWAKQWIVERIEGKVAPASTEPETGIKATDKVRELSKQRLNALAAPAPKGPPVHKPKVK